jgi:hypothetical protein
VYEKRFSDRSLTCGQYFWSVLAPDDTRTPRRTAGRIERAPGRLTIRLRSEGGRERRRRDPRSGTKPSPRARERRPVTMRWLVHRWRSARSTHPPDMEGPSDPRGPTDRGGSSATHGVPMRSSTAPSSDGRWCRSRGTGTNAIEQVRHSPLASASNSGEAAPWCSRRARSSRQRVPVTRERRGDALGLDRARPRDARPRACGLRQAHGGGRGWSRRSHEPVPRADSA